MGAMYVCCKSALRGRRGGVRVVGLLEEEVELAVHVDVDVG